MQQTGGDINEKQLSKLQSKIRKIKKQLKSERKKNQQEKKVVSQQIRALAGEMRSLNKRLAKIQFDEILKFFWFSCVGIFSQFISSGNKQSDTPEARLKFWSKRNRKEEFIVKLVHAIEMGNFKIIAALEKITCDRKKFLDAVKLCSGNLKDEFMDLSQRISKCKDSSAFPTNEALQVVKDIEYGGDTELLGFLVDTVASTPMINARTIMTSS